MSSELWYTLEGPAFYAGVGSRKTPQETQELMTAAARRFYDNGWTLRSGGAIGADSAFEHGAGTQTEIFCAEDATDEGILLASTIHPAWHRCSSYAKALHGRNILQVLGRDLNSPVKGVVCWTPGGIATGGTRTAIILARQHKIPVINLYNTTDLTIKFVEWVLSDGNI